MGEVKGRSLAYVSSPGTYLDTESHEERKVVGVLVEAFEDRHGRSRWSIASSTFDVATGTCVSTEVVVPILDGRPVLDTLESFWAANHPTELVVWSRGVACGESQIRSWFNAAIPGPIHCRLLEPATAVLTRGSLDFLHRIYAPQSALGIATFLGLEGYPTAMECLAHLLRFVEEHNPSYLTKLGEHRMCEPADELLMGNAALQQLGMLPAGPKTSECLLHWLQRATTAVGKRALKERCVKPTTDVAELELRQTRIEELRQRGLTKHLYGIADLPRLYRKFQLGRGGATGLLQLLASYKKCVAIAEEVALTHSAAPTEALAHAHQMLEVWDAERIAACTTGHVLGLGPHHPWRHGQQPILDALEEQWVAVEREVRDLKTGWDGLLDESDAVKVEWRAEDCVFTFSATKRRAAALSTVLKTRRKIVLETATRGSASVATLDCDILRELNGRAGALWKEWEAATASAWDTAWATWQGSAALVDWLGQIDTDAALAACAEEYGYVRPIYEGQDVGSSGLAVVGLRHPILERVHSQTPYISHSIALGCLVSHADAAAAEAAKAPNGILLYGVNAAGKSSLSKAVGLAVLMAQIGMPVPATEMRLVPYKSLFTRILGNDNLWAGMSSFVVEMTEFRSILKAAGPNTLVLGDELCAGTETVSAMAIVGSGIQTLVGRGAQFIFATHLHELMTMPELKGALGGPVRPYHLTVVPDPRGRLVYDRQLKAGSGSPIYGLEVCRGLDMDAEFLEAAMAIRRRLDGAPNLAKVSRYNAAVPVQVCGVCGAKGALETHHIRPQAEADAAGRVAPGRHKNEAGNLVVLCESCHDRHHRGELTIHGWRMTTEGAVLDLSETAHV